MMWAPTTINQITEIFVVCDDNAPILFCPGQYVSIFSLVCYLCYCKNIMPRIA